MGDERAGRGLGDQPTLGNQLVYRGDDGLPMHLQGPRERSRSWKPVAGTKAPALNLDRERSRDLLRDRRSARSVYFEDEFPTCHRACPNV